MNTKKLVALMLTAVLLTGIIPFSAFSVSVTDVSAADRYVIYQNGYKGTYDLQEGIFTYSATTGMDSDAVYYYSDGYFADTPDVYNEHLSTMSLALSMAAFNASKTEFDLSLHSEYANSFRNIKQLLSDIGFEDNNIRISDSFTEKPTDSSIGVVMGTKSLPLDKEYMLIPIVIRGGGYESEWASNVTLGVSGEAKGFADSAEKVMGEFEKFISSGISADVKKSLDNGLVKFLVCGYSRAAAVANITAKRLTDKYGKENSIYAYCFETPMGGVDSAVVKEAHTYNGQYLNIHNIINSGDIVTYVAPAEMGFKRYGVDRFIPGTDDKEIKETVYNTAKEITVTTYSDNLPYSLTDEDYISRRDKMINQLALVNGGITFTDTFDIATLNYLGFALGASGIFLPLQNVDVTASEWLTEFMKDLTEWTTGGEYRDFYSSNAVFAGEEYTSVEKALGTFTKLMFGMENAHAFTDAMTYRMKSLASDKMLIADFYTSVVGSWEKLDAQKKKQYLDTVWEILTNDVQYSDGVSVPKITEFVKDDETEQLKNSMYSLLSFFFGFINKDNSTPALENVTSTQIHLATLLYNASSILQCHYPEICMAWLRTYDSHYEENDKFRFENASVLLAADELSLPEKIEAKGKKTEGGILLTLTSSVAGDEGINNGSAVYYQVFKNGECTADWSLYQAPVLLSDKDGGEYSLKVFSTRFGMKTDVKEITNDMMIIEENTESQSLVKTVVIILTSAAVLALGVGAFVILKKKKKGE